MRIHDVVCEVCGTKFKDTSPPTLEAYESGLIVIAKGEMLLPRAVVALNHKEGMTDTLSADISGDYCSAVCLIKKINSLLHLNGKKIEDLDARTAEAVKEADRRAKEREAKAQADKK